MGGSRRSARVVLETLSRIYRPRSVVDFGCGRGAWLAEARRLGATKLIGLDGDWVNRTHLVDRSIRFLQADFERELPSCQKCDLCLSVEVAEHLSPSRSDAFVAALCEAADVVVFSAAVENQGGTGHVNEQPQSYWIGRFEANGFECFDYFRPRLWNNPAVEVWYRQNLLLFVRPSTKLAKSSALVGSEVVISDIIHPKLLSDRSEGFKAIIRAKNARIERPSTRFVIGVAVRYLQNLVREGWGRRGG